LNDGRQNLKAKGCPKDDHGMSYESYKTMVKDEIGKVKHKFRVRLNFVRNKFESTIRRTELEKTVSMNYDKRVIIKKYRTRPYGTKKVIKI